MMDFLALYALSNLKRYLSLFFYRISFLLTILKGLNS